MFCPAYIQTLQFSNVNIKKRISQQARNYYTYKLRLLHKLKDTNLSYLSKDKKYIKKLILQFALRFLMNISSFDKEARH